MTVDVRMLARLDRIEDELRRLRDVVEGGIRRPTRPESAALLAAIFEAVEGRPFTAFDVLDHVDVAGAADIGAAIEAAVGALSARRLGKLLARVEGETINGLIVRRVGTGRAGLLWRVSRVSRAANSPADSEERLASGLSARSK